LEGGKRKLRCLLGKGRSISDPETSIRPFLASELVYELLASRLGCMNCAVQLRNDYLCFIQRIYIALRSLPLARQRFFVACYEPYHSKILYLPTECISPIFMDRQKKTAIISLYNMKLFIYLAI
jgi:hypothetical protein